MSNHIIPNVHWFLNGQDTHTRPSLTYFSLSLHFISPLTQLVIDDHHIWFLSLLGRCKISTPDRNHCPLPPATSNLSPNYNNPSGDPWPPCWPSACLKQLKALDAKTAEVRNDKYARNTRTHRQTHTHIHTALAPVTAFCLQQGSCQRKKQHYNEKIRGLLWNSMCCWRSCWFCCKKINTWRRGKSEAFSRYVNEFSCIKDTDIQIRVRWVTLPEKVGKSCRKHFSS